VGLDMRVRLIAAIAILLVAQACATLGQFGRLIQPVQFDQADDRGSEIRLVGPRSGQPLGGAAVRIWTRVRNPNPFGLTLRTLRATLMLEDTRAADGEFPLGLPLQGGQDTVVPLDLSISFSDVPALATMLRRSSLSQPLRYRVEGSFGVDVGNVGSPTFGPMTLFAGEMRAPAFD
jgi:late embryogenesis abundant protein